MNSLTRRYSTILATIIAASLLLPAATAQTQKRTLLAGHVHPLATAENDRGPVDPATKLTYLILFVKRSSEQQSALDGLIKQQLDLGSPSFHRWLTPEQFADRFGAPQESIDRLAAWLRSSGFSGLQVSRGRDYIVFNGTAGQVEAALQTQIHRYDANGEIHFANREAPSVPEDLSPLVAGFQGLHNFTPKPFYRRRAGRPMKMPGAAPVPQFRDSADPSLNILAPDDLAAIYNIKALYKSGIDGAGQAIAIAGSSDIDMGDIEKFRSVFGLPFNDPQQILVPGSDDPGFNDGMGEADLDLEWSGAVARNATLLYVYSTNAFVAAFYAIDQALAPVLSVSFGVCELRATESDAARLMAEAEKAAAEGITWIAASGDAGAAGCEDQNAASVSAITRMNPNLPASLPYVTGVGGSEFNEGSGSYWSNTLGPDGGSALSYIPEAGWTDEQVIAAKNLNGFASSGGGASWFFGKPAWQSGPGVPNDSARDVPDVAITASWFHDAYVLRTGGEFIPSGGTSAAGPVFAGIASLIGQYLNQMGPQRYNGLGFINPTLYSLAGTAPAAFHDIMTGSNIVPCVPQSTQDCTSSGFMGYRAGPGYDQVTGLGSVDAYTLALSWRAAVAKTAHLTVTQFTAATKAQVGGPLSVSLHVANAGDLDAGAFQIRILFTSDGAQATANDFSIFCDAKGLAAGASTTCSGTVNLGASITPGVYILLGIADFNQTIPQADRSGNAALASTGPLTVTR